MKPGCLFVSLEGTDISDEEHEMLSHPMVVGVILFKKNYLNPDQIRNLVQKIKSISQPELIIAVDHEGGRVKRFPADEMGWFDLFPMAALGKYYAKDPVAAISLAESTGIVASIDVLRLGVDLSFAPVLDVDHGRSQIIGDRAFAQDPQIVVSLTSSFVIGQRRVGMAPIGKHFPGHGYVIPDSHMELPVDERSLPDLEKDIFPYRVLNKHLSGVMMAHIRYPAFDEYLPAFSSQWIHYLRTVVQFSGVIFSDDLAMKAIPQDHPEQTMKKALSAGCEMLLYCHQVFPSSLLDSVASLIPESAEKNYKELVRTEERNPADWDEIYGEHRERLNDFVKNILPNL